MVSWGETEGPVSVTSESAHVGFECLLSGTKHQGSQHLTCWLILPKYWKFKQNDILTVNYGHHCTSLSNSVTLVFPFKSIPVDKLKTVV